MLVAQLSHGPRLRRLAESQLIADDVVSAPPERPRSRSVRPCPWWWSWPRPSRRSRGCSS